MDLHWAAHLIHRDDVFETAPVAAHHPTGAIDAHWVLAKRQLLHDAARAVAL